jgi:hypothetical protein
VRNGFFLAQATTCLFPYIFLVRLRTPSLFTGTSLLYGRTGTYAFAFYRHFFGVLLQNSSKIAKAHDYLWAKAYAFMFCWGFAQGARIRTLKLA